jgi:hypothetical protein
MCDEYDEDSDNYCFDDDYDAFNDPDNWDEIDAGIEEHE